MRGKTNSTGCTHWELMAVPPAVPGFQSGTGPSSVGIIDKPEREQAIAEGDIVIIPAGVAHGFSEISSPITYVVVRVDPERLVALK